MPDKPSMLDYAEAVLARVKELIGKMRAPTSAPGRPRAALFLTIAEQFEASILLGRAGMGTHGAVHVRSMLEALVSMNLLATSTGYVDQMRFEKLRGEKNLYERLLSNPDIPPKHLAVLQARQVECKAQYDPLFAQGLRPRRISEDFVPAGLGDFIGPYTVLCGLSHNDLATLAYRHQGETGMTYKAVVPDEMMQTVYSLAMAVMVSAAQPMGAIARFSVDGHFDLVFQDMNNAWGAYLQSVGARRVGTAI